MAKTTRYLNCLLLLLFISGCNSYRFDLDLRTRFTNSLSPTQLDHEQKLVRENLQRIYIAETGVRETEGNNRGPRIREYMATVGLPDGHAWCGGYAKFCFEHAGIPTPGANGWAASWFPKDKVIWTSGAGSRLGKSPQTGDLFSIYTPSLKRIGHVGIVDYYDDNYILTSEGNTNGGGSREGDAVARRRRPLKQIHSMSDWITPYLKNK